MTSGGITGVLGQAWRGDVTTYGAVVPWDGSPALDWHVAADDRWHSPASEVAVRQRRLRGAPVFETKVRVPGGNVVQRIWSVPDRGGLTLVVVTNDSPLPIACALTRADLLTTRPPTSVPIEGIDLPLETTVLPIGHRSQVAAALDHTGGGPGPLPPGIAGADAVARGWVAVAQRASRLVLPDESLVEAVVAARCDVLLRGVADAYADPVAYLLDLGELGRMGELTAGDLDAAVPDIAAIVERIARRSGWGVDAALAASARLLASAGERRAVEDVGRIIAARPSSTVPPSAEGTRAVAAIERGLVRGTELFPDGVPAQWRGVDLEAHGLAAGPRTTVSYAVRWHGARPAVLWQVDGDPVVLTAPRVDPSWRSAEPSGEALWREPST